MSNKTPIIGAEAIAARAFVEGGEMLQALSSYAGRVAQTNDPDAHQEAAKQLQKNLAAIRKKTAPST